MAIGDIIAGFSGSLVGNTLNAVYVAVIFAVLFILGAIVAKIVNIAIRGLLRRGRLEEKIKAKNLENALLGFSITRIVTALASAYIVLVFLGAAADIVNMPFMTSVIYGLIGYLTSLTQGLAIIVAVLFVAAYISNIICTSGRCLFNKQIATAVKFILAYLALIMALPLILPNVQGSVAVLSSILTLFISALVVAFGLAVGLALGLGLKDSVAAAAKKNQPLFDELFARAGKK